LTLTGQVLAIGGVKEKVIAARRNGLRTIILPFANKKDYAELPEHITKGIDIHYASTFNDVVQVAF
jgi:ATP-dependent Lon protease